MLLLSKKNIRFCFTNCLEVVNLFLNLFLLCLHQQEAKGKPTSLSLSSIQENQVQQIFEDHCIWCVKSEEVDQY